MRPRTPGARPIAGGQGLTRTGLEGVLLVVGETLKIARMSGEAARLVTEYPISEVRATGNSSDISLTVRGQPFLSIDWWEEDDGNRLRAALAQ